jgi:tetratricopeptide (TPR) repeat protein
MPKKKVSRKQLLKEPDEFISTTGKVLQFLRAHQRQMILYGMVGLALLAAGSAGYLYIHWQENKALAIQEQAYQLYQDAFRKAGNAEAEKENYRRALEKFREVRSVSRWGKAAEVSQLYIGHCHYALKEYDQAIAAYTRCLDGPFQSMARNGLGYCYEAKKDYAMAAENYQKNAGEKGSPYQEEGLLGVARCYEAQNQKQKALETYQKALAENPKSPMAGFIQWKISELKG